MRLTSALRETRGRQIVTVASQVDAGEDDLRETRLREAAHLLEDLLGRHAAAASAGGGDDAVAAGEVAPFLDLEEGAGAAEEAPAEPLLERLETYRTPDGGYSPTAGAGHGTAYGCFLALGAYEDLGATLANPGRLVGVPDRVARRRRRLRQPAGDACGPDAADRRGGDAATSPLPSGGPRSRRVASGALSPRGRVLRDAGDAGAGSALDRYRAARARGRPRTARAAQGAVPRLRRQPLDQLRRLLRKLGRRRAGLRIHVLRLCSPWGHLSL